jgi:VanZ family protein
VKRVVIEYWTPLVLWLIVIFFFSTDLFAANRTSTFIVPVLHFLFPSLSPDGLNFWHGVIRKCGHVTEYFILAILTYRSLKLEQTGAIRTSLRTLAFVAFAASFDELHQRFTLFRTASPIDVGYDCLGAVWALCLIMIYETRRLRTHTLL